MFDTPCVMIDHYIRATHQQYYTIAYYSINPHQWATDVCCNIQSSICNTVQYITAVHRVTCM